MSGLDRSGAWISLALGVGCLGVVDLFLLPGYLEAANRSELRVAQGNDLDGLLAEVQQDAPTVAAGDDLGASLQDAGPAGVEGTPPVLALGSPPEHGVVTIDAGPAPTDASEAQVRESPLDAPLAARLAPPTELEPTNRDWTVYFAFGTAKLSRRARRTLRAVVRHQRNTPGFISLVGRTDPTGPDSYNLRLSRRRAQAVARWLEKRGIRPDDLAVQGRGEEGADPKANSRSRRERRRVDVAWSRP